MSEGEKQPQVCRVENEQNFYGLLLSSSFIENETEIEMKTIRKL